MVTRVSQNDPNIVRTKNAFRRLAYYLGVPWEYGIRNFLLRLTAS